MKFDRITENKVYERIVSATNKLWEEGVGSSVFEDHPEFKKLKLNYKRCTTAGFGICGQGEYSGVIITDGDNEYRVISMFVDTLCPEYTRFEDVTNKLGESNPAHNQCDIRQAVPMAILYYLELFGKVPKQYAKYC